MVSPMVVSMAAIYDAFSELQGVRQYQELIDLELLKMGAFVAAEMTPQLWAASVKMPVLMAQVLEDSWTRNPEDAQKTFDLLASKDKELFWIENTTRGGSSTTGSLAGSSKGGARTPYLPLKTDAVRIWSITYRAVGV